MAQQVKEENRIVYHYTDIDALMAIVRPGYIQLRATNCMFLNDSNEIKEGIDIMKEKGDTSVTTDTFKDYYLTSFSFVKDDLKMWGMYAANGSGVAIGFKLKLLQSAYGGFAECEYDKAKICNNFDEHLSHKKLVLEAQKIAVEQNIKSVLTEKPELLPIIHNFPYIATCISSKNPAYSYEQEARCFLCNRGQNVKFRNRKGVITPYVDIIVPREALCEIVIGPANNQDLSHRSIARFLEINGYNLSKENIIKSAIPYRG